MTQPNLKEIFSVIDRKIDASPVSQINGEEYLILKRKDLIDLVDLRLPLKEAIDVIRSYQDLTEVEGVKIKPKANEWLKKWGLE